MNSRKIPRKPTNIYLSDQERALLEELAARSEMTMNAYVRQLLRQAADTGMADNQIELPRKQHAVKYAQ